MVLYVLQLIVPRLVAGPLVIFLKREATEGPRQVYWIFKLILYSQWPLMKTQTRPVLLFLEFNPVGDSWLIIP